MDFSRKCFATTLLAVSLLALGTSPLALASGASRSRDRVKAVCAKPRPHAAVFEALRLLAAASSSASAAQSRAYSASGTPARKPNETPAPGGLTPQLLHGAYLLPDQTAVSASQTIALVDAYNDPAIEEDLAVYDKQFGLPECTKANGCFRKVNQEAAESPLPPSNGDWSSEISLDVQMAHAICQNCHILLVEAGSEEFAALGAAANTAASLGATEISNSYGSNGPEAEVAKEERELNGDYDHPGVVVAASAGDCGYENDNNNEGYFSCMGLPADVSFPAASPDVLAVGGTALTESEGTWTSSAWENTGGGCSSIFSAPAWQTAVSGWSGTGCGSDRLVADVSAVADPYTGVDVYDTVREEGNPETGWQVYGGTSASSPILAAEFALAGGAHGVSYPAKTLYGHLGEASALYDVVSGSNEPSCPNTSCKAGPGYDGPTGLGSPLGLSAFATESGTPANTSPPKIAGTAEVGRELTLATPGVWTNSPTAVGDQWEDCNASGTGCVPIEGAIGTSYLVAPSDGGFTIRLQETVSNAKGFGPPASSAATALVPAPPPPPRVAVISPKNGPAGTVVTITGSHFVDVSSVTFGAAQASFTVKSEETITAEAPAGSGTVLVVVKTRGGTSEGARRSKDKFRYKKPKKH